MIIHMRFAFLLIFSIHLLSIQAVAGFLFNSKDALDGPLSVYVKQEFTRPPGEEHFFLKGAVSRIVFSVENTSDEFIIIRNFDIQEQLPDIYRWYGSVYGGAEYMPLRNEWLFSEIEQRLSEPVFARGVIYPGGKLDITRHAVLKKNTIHVVLSYQKLSKKEAERYLYVYFRGKNKFSSHRKFVPCKNIESISIEDVDWELVVFPKANRLAIEKQVHSCRISLREPEFSLKDAERKIGLQADASVYWKQQEAWVIGKDKNRYLVSQGNITPYPEMDLLSFIIIEFSHKTIPVILPMSGYDRFHAVHPKIEGPGYFNPGVTQLKEDELLSLFMFVREKGDSISVLVYDPTGLGKRFYLLVGDFDEKKRRAVIGNQR